MQNDKPETFVVAASDGTTHYDENMYNALARVLLDMTGRAHGICVNVFEIHHSQVQMDMETGIIQMDKVDGKDPKYRQFMLNFNVEQAKAAKQLHNLAEMAEVVRDALMTSLIGEFHNAMGIESSGDTPAEQEAGVADGEGAPTATKH